MFFQSLPGYLGGWKRLKQPMGNSFHDVNRHPSFRFSFFRLNISRLMGKSTPKKNKWTLQKWETYAKHLTGNTFNSQISERPANLPTNSARKYATEHVTEHEKKLRGWPVFGSS
jgi:hypothetical protein